MSKTYISRSCFLGTQENNNKVWVNSIVKGKKSWNNGVKFALNRSKFVHIVGSIASSNGSSSNGRFGKYGGKYVPELLIASLSKLEHEFYKTLNDETFQEELETGLKDYVGRETPLYFAERLTNYYKSKNNGIGGDIYLKREDLNHGGAHKINNALGQSMLAKHMGLTSIVTATSAGQHGVALAAVCAKLSLDCTVFMGRLDIERQSYNVNLMKLLGARVKSVDGTYKDANSEAVREWIANIETSYHLPATIVGPHPCPTIAREFQSIIAYKRLCKLEGIIPALETSHAIAFLDKLCPTLTDGTKVVVNCSGRGDKDVATVLDFDQLPDFTSSIIDKKKKTLRLAVSKE